MNHFLQLWWPPVALIALLVIGLVALIIHTYRTRDEDLR